MILQQVYIFGPDQITIHKVWTHNDPNIPAHTFNFLEFLGLEHHTRSTGFLYINIGSLKDCFRGRYVGKMNVFEKIVATPIRYLLAKFHSIYFHGVSGL